MVGSSSDLPSLEVNRFEESSDHPLVQTGTMEVLAMNHLAGLRPECRSTSQKSFLELISCIAVVPPLCFSVSLSFYIKLRLQNFFIMFYQRNHNIRLSDIILYISL